MSDLEKQLQASIPGRETAVQDHARAWAARCDIKRILETLRSHRAELAVAISAQDPIHGRLSEALLLLAQVHADLERVHLPRLLLACNPCPPPGKASR